MKTYARPLRNQTDVDYFLSNCLNLNPISNLQDSFGKDITASRIAMKIRDAEGAINMTNEHCTLSSDLNRVNEYRSDDKREQLRKQIIAELVGMDRLDNDDEITLFHGGAKPKENPAKADKNAYIIIGLPASGKSTIVNKCCDKLGAIILDSDFAKRKLPEFDGSLAGANLVHKESSSIIFGGDNGAPSLFGYCKNFNLNIVTPKIGHDYNDLIEMRNAYIDAGYSVHLTATLLQRHEATLRALKRFIATGRYVPLGLIFDGYANDPIMNYYRIVTEATLGFDTKWASYAAINTSGCNTVIHCSSDQNPASLLH